MVSIYIMSSPQAALLLVNTLRPLAKADFLIMRRVTISYSQPVTLARLYSDHAQSDAMFSGVGPAQRSRFLVMTKIRIHFHLETALQNKVGCTRCKGYRKLKYIGTVMLCISDLLVNSKLQRPFTLEKPQAIGFSVVLTNSNFFIFLYFIFKW